MFRTLARLLVDPDLSHSAAQPTDDVFLIHPLQLSRWLDEMWVQQRAALLGTQILPLNQPGFLGDPNVVKRLQLPERLRNDGLRSGIAPKTPATGFPNPTNWPGQIDAFNQPPSLGSVGLQGVPGEHLIYAFLVESTGVFEVLAEVVRRMAVGESLDPPSAKSQQWLRATEDLFFRDPPLFHITSLVSEFRPDMRINRRNSYWRMFGMDLPHALPRTRSVTQAGETPPWKRDVGAAANVRFRELWSELLTQVWLGIEHDNNASGPNPTDPAYVAYLCQSIEQHFALRRSGGMLAREEFSAVASLSWFHLTVDVDSPIVVDLAAQAASPADRLAKIGQRVGITPSAHSRELFELADLMSNVLRFIEAGEFSAPGKAALLYEGAGGTTALRDAMNRTVDLWQLATGERIKDAAVRVVGSRRAPSAMSPNTSPPTRTTMTSMPRPSPVASGNGSRT